MRHRIASILFFALFACLALACEAVSHANDFGTSSAVQSCGTGTLFCNGTCIAEDAQNCGSCGATCEPTQVCSEGTCGSECTGGTTLCNNLCVDTKTDPKNCGRCGGPIDGGACPFCQSGKCVSRCSQPQKNCGGSCIDVTSDAQNCGDCGNTCPPQQPLCNGGKCDISCGAQAQCDTGCADLQLDPDNCGGCGNVCATPMNLQNQATGSAVCVDGQCGVACDEGLTFCREASPDGERLVCADLANDPKHCGACTTSCGGSSATPLCHQGVCQSG